MTIDEACDTYDYSVSIYREDKLWYWCIEGGYHTVDSSVGYFTVKDAENDLNNYLSTFEGFK